MQDPVGFASTPVCTAPIRRVRAGEPTGAALLAKLEMLAEAHGAHQQLFDLCEVQGDWQRLLDYMAGAHQPDADECACCSVWPPQLLEQRMVRTRSCLPCSEPQGDWQRLLSCMAACIAGALEPQCCAAPSPQQKCLAVYWRPITTTCLLGYTAAFIADAPDSVCLLQLRDPLCRMCA